MTEFLVCFNCCIGDHPQTKRLDRKMIGEPMNFVHITHFGTKEMTNNPPSVSMSGREATKCYIWILYRCLGRAYSGTDEFQRRLQQQFNEY